MNSFYTVYMFNSSTKLAETHGGSVQPDLMTKLLQFDRELTVPIVVYPLTNGVITYKKDVWTGFDKKINQSSVTTVTK